MTRPNTARVLDYWMGGTHNFEIDRQFGDQVKQAVPLIVTVQQNARETLQRVVRYMVQDLQLRVLVDFGAGLPTCGNTHIIAQELDPNVRVLYDDLDPLTVFYSRQILQGINQVTYVQGDAQDPLAVLEQPEAQALLAGERRVGFIYMALAHLMADDQVQRAARSLYEWAAPGSYWFLTHATPDWDTDPALAAAADLYRRARVQFYLRPPARLVELLQPWQVAPGGSTFNMQWGLAEPMVKTTNPGAPLSSFETLVSK